MKTLEELLRVPNSQATEIVTHKATIYHDQIKVFVPNNYLEKLQAGLELNRRLSNISKSITSRGESMNREENIDRSTQRARKTVSDLIKNNHFTLFVTLTLSAKQVDRTNPETVKKELNKWLKAERRRFPGFEYIIIPECHKDGSLHFHALFQGYDDIVPAKHPEHEGQMIRKGRLVYNLRTWKLGFTDVEIIQDKNRVSTYVRKYITKDMPTFLNKKRYWWSRGLQKPQYIDNLTGFDPENPPATSNMYASDYGMTYVYHQTTLPLVGQSVNHLVDKNDPLVKCG